MVEPAQVTQEEIVTCQHCEKPIGENEEIEVTRNEIYCKACFTDLSDTYQDIIQRQGQDINYPYAVVGALVGAVIGAAAWWGFSVLTKIEPGFIAVVVGYTVAKGILITTGGKRSLSLQMISVLVSVIAYFYANYLVSCTSFLKENPDNAGVLGLLPHPTLFIEITRLSFGVYTLVYLAIVLFVAWGWVSPVKMDWRWRQHTKAHKKVRS